MIATAPPGTATVSCPGCRAEHRSPAVLLSGRDRMVGAPGRFDVIRCDACGLAFTEPRLRDQDFPLYYPDTYNAYVPSAAPRSLLGRVGAIVDRLRLEAIIRRGPYREVWRRGPCRLLDVGCSRGDLAAVFARHGYRVSGIEPSAGAADRARGRGIDVHRGTLDDAPWPEGSFDVVIFNHSLEHIDDPAEALGRVARLLRPGGILAIAVPNFGSWHRQAFGSRWFQLDLPRHLQHFDRASLTLLTHRAGFRPIRVETASMRPSLLGSLQYVAFGRLRLEGRAFRLLTWASLPLVAVSDLAGEGDCLHLTAQLPE